MQAVRNDVEMVWLKSYQLCGNRLINKSDVKL
jgi:hypothetical protein